jgi:hypothetical protein
VSAERGSGFVEYKGEMFCLAAVDEALDGLDGQDDGDAGLAVSGLKRIKEQGKAVVFSERSEPSDEDPEPDAASLASQSETRTVEPPRESKKVRAARKRAAKEKARADKPKRKAAKRKRAKSKKN